MEQTNRMIIVCIVLYGVSIILLYVLEWINKIQYNEINLIKENRVEWDETKLNERRYCGIKKRDDRKNKTSVLIKKSLNKACKRIFRTRSTFPGIITGRECHCIIILWKYKWLLSQKDIPFNTRNQLYSHLHILPRF